MLPDLKGSGGGRGRGVSSRYDGADMLDKGGPRLCESAGDKGVLQRAGLGDCLRTKLKLREIRGDVRLDACWAEGRWAAKKEEGAATGDVAYAYVLAVGDDEEREEGGVRAADSEQPCPQRGHRAGLRRA